MGDYMYFVRSPRTNTHSTNTNHVTWNAEEFPFWTGSNKLKRLYQGLVNNLTLTYLLPQGASAQQTSSESDNDDQLGKCTKLKQTISRVNI